MSFFFSQGALGALLMIALVRAVSTRTKEICARALLNLLNDGTIDEVLEEGAVQAFATLCNLDSEECLSVCAMAFQVLSHHPKGRLKIVSKQAIMRGLFSLIRSTSMETQKLCGRTVYNLLLDSETQVKAATSGALGVVKVICTLNDPRAYFDCANAIAKISELPMAREYIIKENIPSALVLLAQQPYQLIVVATIRAICCLSTYKHLRAGKSLEDLSSLVGWHG